jgi:ParB/RepB/Spo0J family partition protein
MLSSAQGISNRKGVFMPEVVKIDPFLCEVWEWHGRMEEYITVDSCKDEILSMQQHGQLVPAIGRRVSRNSSWIVEIICGVRRLYAARHLNIEIAVELREVSDREAIVLVDIENRLRRDWSAYERGRIFSKWMTAGHFESQDELARSLQISTSQVSRLLKLAKLPAVIVEAFADPSDICEAWGLHLHNACEKTESRSRIIGRARTLRLRSTPRVPRDVFAYLCFDGDSRNRRRRQHHEVVVDRHGRPLFRIKQREKTVAVLIDKKSMSSVALTRIKDALAEILQDGIPQVVVTINDNSAIPDSNAPFRMPNASSIASGLVGASQLESGV